MQSARGKLKTSLEEVEKDEKETFEGDEDTPERPKKRQRIATEKARQFATPTTIHQSYVMKLFDRSVDLARFDERSPLYPICRR